MRFTYDQAILQRFPSIRGGILFVRGLQSGLAASDLAREYALEQERVKTRLGDSSLADLPSIAAWRRAFSTFGVKPTQYRSAAESLLRRLTKKGDIPSINRYVDLGNMVSIRHALPVAVIDAAGIAG
jgi:DNA/RNA-binding domain of Phe-tRNA-synthetase-like protein